MAAVAVVVALSVEAHGMSYPGAALEEGVMGTKKATKSSSRTGQRSAVGDLPTRQLRTGQAGGIKGGLITRTTLPEARRSKNEVAIETLKIAHEGPSY